MPSGHTERRQNSGATGGRQSYRIRQEGNTQPGMNRRGWGGPRSPHPAPAEGRGRRGRRDNTQPYTGPARPHQAPHSRRRGPGSQAGGRGCLLQDQKGKGESWAPMLHPHRARQDRPSRGGSWRASEASEAQQMPCSYRIRMPCLRSCLAGAPPSVQRRGPAYPAAGGWSAPGRGSD